MICFDRPGEKGVRVYIHGGQEPVEIPGVEEICYSRKFENGTLMSGGVLVTRL